MNSNRLPTVWRPPDYQDRDHQGADLPAPLDFSKAELSEPARPATFHADVLVPALQAVLSGLFVGGVAAGLHSPWPGPLVWGAVGAALTWGAVLGDTRQLLRRTKRILGSLASEASAVVKHEYTICEDRGDNRAHERILLDLPADPVKLGTFARGILGGRSPSIATWTGSTGLFTRGQYEQLIDRLISEGFARRTNPKDPHGTWALTAKGKAWFRGLAGQE